MKVKMTSGVAGNGYSYASGQVVDLPGGVAERFISAGIATALEPTSPPTKPPAARATKATSRRAKKSEKR